MGPGFLMCSRYGNKPVQHNQTGNSNQPVPAGNPGLKWANSASSVSSAELMRQGGFSGNLFPVKPQRLEYRSIRLGEQYRGVLVGIGDAVGYP